MGDFMELKHCRVIEAGGYGESRILDVTLIGDEVEIGITEGEASMCGICIAQASALALADWIIDHIRGDKS